MFKKQYNGKKIYRGKAPLRISFCGGGTDIPMYYERHGGVVLSATIDKYSHVSLIPNDDNQIRIKSLDFDINIEFGVDTTPVLDGVLDLVKAVISSLNIKQGFDLYIHSDVPPGSGLGTSSTVTTAIIGVLLKFLNESWDKYDIAEFAYHLERVQLKILGGKQDQYASTFGGLNLIEFYQDKTIVNALTVHKGIMNDLSCHLMMCYTGKVHFSTELIAKHIAHFDSGRELTHTSLDDLKSLTYQMKDSLLTGNLNAFGKLLHIAGDHKRKSNPDSYNDHIDNLYKIALANGAIGGKILGAGDGGFLLLFCEVTKKHNVTKALESVGGQLLNFGFDRKGLQVWESYCS